MQFSCTIWITALVHYYGFDTTWNYKIKRKHSLQLALVDFKSYMKHNFQSHCMHCLIHSMMELSRSLGSVLFGNMMAIHSEFALKFLCVSFVWGFILGVFLSSFRRFLCVLFLFFFHRASNNKVNVSVLDCLAIYYSTVLV